MFIRYFWYIIINYLWYWLLYNYNNIKKIAKKIKKDKILSKSYYIYC